MSKKTTVLMILDGYGLNEKTEHNAVAIGKTPVMDRLMKEYPFVRGNASGMAVGLPDGQMGNSEVGHLNMGAGRIVYQELTRITKEIQDGTFFENPALMEAVENCKAKNAALHLFGLLSDGGVHSHNTHLYGLLELAKRNGLSEVYVHCFLDGRDTPPASGKGFAEQLEEKMAEIGVGKIASVMGRYYAMDRDNNYDRVQKAYEAMTAGIGEQAASGPAAIQQSYDNDKTDEFVLPTVVAENGKAIATIKDGDSVIFFNFRPDRAREITRAFCDDDFKGFDRKRLDLKYVCFSDYDPTIPNKSVAFHKISVTNTFGEWLAANKMTQARIAETEKYAHVTFFFNGGVEEPNEGEDMVGHTGVEEAAIKAVEAVDECVGKAVDAILEVNGTMFICADHGNAEQLVDYETGAPFTAHTTNPVPFILVNYDPAYTLREGGCLADIVPTLIETMGMQQPAEMTGKSLLVRK